jgi:hypothetical protein
MKTLLQPNERVQHAAQPELDAIPTDRNSAYIINAVFAALLFACLPTVVR